MDPLLGILAIGLLVSANGFFVAAEFGLVSARRTRIMQLALEGNRAAKATQNAVENLDSFIAATQLGITLASLSLGWVGEPAIAPLFERFLHVLPIPPQTLETISTSLSIAISFAIVTLLHIVFGELVPKAIALQHPEATAMMVARPTTWFLIIFRPVIWIMNGVGNAVVRALGFSTASGHSSVHSVEELEMLVHSSREAGVLQESEEQLVRAAFDFADINVREIMQPRTSVAALAVDMALHTVLQRIAALRYSRYPVYEGSIDQVIGILHTKDLLDLIASQPLLLSDPTSPAPLRQILRSPLFVPASVGMDVLLAQMQRTKTQFAVVIDEYGGMAGVATMEDVIEELVGDVQDEFDQETLAIQTTGNTLVIDGLVSLSEIADRFGDPVGEAVEATTIGGYLTERLDRIPQVGDVVQYDRYDLRVEAMEGRRVASVRFILREAVPTVSG